MTSSHADELAVTPSHAKELAVTSSHATIGVALLDQRRLEQPHDLSHLGDHLQRLELARSGARAAGVLNLRHDLRPLHCTVA